MSKVHFDFKIKPTTKLDGKDEKIELKSPDYRSQFYQHVRVQATFAPVKLYVAISLLSHQNIDDQFWRNLLITLYIKFAQLGHHVA